MERIDLMIILLLGVVIVVTATLPAFYLGKMWGELECYGR